MALTAVPASPKAKNACRIDVTAAPAQRAPNLTGGAFRYKITATGPSGQVLTSHEFSPTPAGKVPDGGHSWQNVVFPASGTWALRLVDTFDSSVDQGPTNITVQA